MEFLQQVWDGIKPEVVAFAAGLVIYIVGLSLAALRTYVAGLKDQRIKMVAEIVVKAAQQKYGAGAGKQKFEWASEQLKKRGLPADVVHIEAAVGSLKKFSASFDEKPETPAVAG